MPYPMVAELKEGGEISQGIYAVSGMEIRTARSGKPYLRLRLTDCTGSVNGQQFDCSDLPKDLSEGDAVAVSGVYDQFGIKIAQLLPYRGEVDPADFLPTTTKNVDEMAQELQGIGLSVVNPALAALLEYFREKFWGDFILWPGSERIHHAYLGGLLEHTLAVAKICSSLSQSYSVDRDLLISASILHDLGKVEELQLRLAIARSKSGSLLGHTYLGARMVQESILALRGLSISFPEELERRLVHIVLSHHGNLEWGAVVKPMTLEAFIVHVADLADSQAHRFSHIIEDQRRRGVTLGPRDFFLETKVYSPLEDGVEELEEY